MQPMRIKEKGKFFNFFYSVHYFKNCNQNVQNHKIELRNCNIKFFIGSKIITICFKMQQNRKHITEYLLYVILT